MGKFEDDLYEGEPDKDVPRAIDGAQDDLSVTDDEEDSA